MQILSNLLNPAVLYTVAFIAMLEIALRLEPRLFRRRWTA